MTAESSQPLLQIEGLRTAFHTDEGTTVAVDGVDLRVEAGQTLGLVGESGSGKSVTSLSVMQLLPKGIAKIEKGGIAFLGKDVVKLPEKEMRELRGDDIAMIFQEPGTSLNPVMRVGAQVIEAIVQHEAVSKKAARERAIALFEEVGIPDPQRRIDSYPHEMSGGQKQRVMIAMALSCNPKLLIADEPTTALDVTIQKQILDLIRKLRDERDMGILFITHDLGVIAEIADRVAVMFRGKLVEEGDVETIFRSAKHPYTKGLLACRPRLDTTWRRLPTVADFMDVEEREDGTIEIVEKASSVADLEERFGEGRGRYLHPPAALEAMGHPIGEGLTEGATTVPADEEPLLQVKDLRVWFPIRKGFLGRVKDHVKAVDGVSFDVYRGQTLGLVGESGCGKTTTGRAILRLQKRTEGSIRYDGVDVAEHRGAALKDWRRKVQIVFQDPYASLNPRMTVGSAIAEGMEIHGIGDSKANREKRAAELLEEVGLSADHLRRYPHEFSGGQRQRVGIARALAVQPDLIVLDESVSALDVSVQAQVLNLLKDLQEERQLTYVFISHDLSVVKFMADMMAVMNAGKIVELGPSEAIYANPAEEYTQRLIEAIPDDSHVTGKDTYRD
ncbi:MAG: ABC transporter ATP-binding protein [Deltaproteobacteria bacterium]|nr:ABC transporter ATP-binding protein [Deltaproteobacteria bacterium]